MMRVDVHIEMSRSDIEAIKSYFGLVHDWQVKSLLMSKMHDSGKDLITRCQQIRIDLARIRAHSNKEDDHAARQASQDPGDRDVNAAADTLSEHEGQAAGGHQGHGVGDGDQPRGGPSPRHRGTGGGAAACCGGRCTPGDNHDG